MGFKADVDLKRLSHRLRRELGERVLSNAPIMEFVFQFMLIYVALDAIIVAWFLITPFAVQSSNRLVFGVGMLAYNFGYLVTNCHQMPHHSLIFGTFEMPFCARDTGVYIGCLIGAMLPFTKMKAPRWLKSPAFLLLSLLPLVVDGTTQIFLLRESNNILRLATGLLLGFGAAYFFFANLIPYCLKVVDAAEEYVKTRRITVGFVIIILLVGYFVGPNYVTKEQAIAKSGMTPTFVTYLSSRALETIPWDPYLPSYNDAVLREAVSYGHHRNGVWVLYNGTMEHQGKYVWFSGGDGKITMIKDLRD